MALDPTPLVETATFTATVQGPLANSTVESNDVNTGLQSLANRTKYLHEDLLADKRIQHVYFNVPATPFVVGPPNTFSGNTWTDSIVEVDVASCVANDDLEISVWGTWQLNATSAPGDIVGRLRIKVREDALGAPLDAFPTGLGTITDDGGNLAVPHNEPYALTYRHRITSPGTARVTLQVRSEDLTGGAGTATLILVFSARLDVVRYHRS